MTFDYEAITWGGGDAIDPKGINFLDQSLHLRYALDALATSTGNILEIGCGSGRFIASVAAARPDFNEVHGCDISESALGDAQQRWGIMTQQASASELPYATNAFDAVLMIDVLEHLPHIEIALKEARRVLKPGGVFHLVFPCEGHRWTLHGLINPLYRLKRKHAGHIQRLSPKALLQALENATLAPQQRFYSYHVLGQLYDAAIWSAVEFGALSHDMRHRIVDRRTQASNAAAFKGALLRAARRSLSAALYLEARLLKHCPSGMTLHVTCD